MEPLFFLILSLFAGAAIRFFLRKVPLPYTVILLLLGVLLGTGVRTDFFEKLESFLGKPIVDFSIEALRWAGEINPHLLLFVFLPILIFEASFGMNVHIFKKILPSAILLAVPGFLIALGITGLAVMGITMSGIGLETWNWNYALMLGAVISATDPVAVVAILKEVGASKKLSSLIDGESLLNDGTGIVFFMMFFLPLTGVISDNNAVVEFLRVSAGGVMVGVILGWIIMNWVKKVISDAMIEITVVAAAAYLAFIVSEHFLHVSGIIALVGYGLMMAGPGRSKISPRVEHFMNEFWELAAFIANTVLFIIVGLVIAQRPVFTVNDFIVLGIVYAGIHVARIFAIGLLYPFLKKSGYGINFKDAVVMWWGALRGALALALALIVAEEKSLPEEFRNQFLFIVAGVVTLTLLINATTAKALMNFLGITKPTPAKARMIALSYSQLQHELKEKFSEMYGSRFFGKANWKVVNEFVNLEMPESSVAESGGDKHVLEITRRILEMEKSVYWELFHEGVIGSDAVRILTEGVSSCEEQKGKVSLSMRSDLEANFKKPKLLILLSKNIMMGKVVQKLFIKRLETGYECARGFCHSHEQILKLIGQMIEDNTNSSVEAELETMRTEAQENLLMGQTFIRNLRVNYPEAFRAIVTRQAIRQLLHESQYLVGGLLHSGKIDRDEAERLDEKIKELTRKFADHAPGFEEKAS